MTYSPLATYIKESPNHSGKRTHKIDTITIHHMAGNMTVEACGLMFANKNNKVSSNYGIGTDGKIAGYVPEEYRSWCSSNEANDQRAITIEVANCKGSPNWEISDSAYNSLVSLCYDICKRNGIAELKWRNDKSLIGQVDKQNMTVHKWFAATACPGPYLIAKLGGIASDVNKLLHTEQKEDEEMEGKYYQIGPITDGEMEVFKSVFLSMKPIEEQKEETKTWKVGDKVDVKETTTYEGKKFYKYYDYYEIISITGNRVVIGVDGVVTCAVNINNLKEVDE